jgi:hypothetical protein
MDYCLLTDLIPGQGYSLKVISGLCKSLGVWWPIDTQAKFPF